MCFLLPLDEENVRKIMRRANQLEHAWKMSLLSTLERKKPCDNDSTAIRCYKFCYFNSRRIVQIKCLILKTTNFVDIPLL